MAYLISEKLLKKYEWVRDKTIYTGDVAGSEMEGGWRPDRSNYTQSMKFDFLVDTEVGRINQPFLSEIFEKLMTMEYELMCNLEKKRERLRPYNKNTNNQYEVEKLEQENFPILSKQMKIEKAINIRNQDHNWPIRYYSTCFHFEATTENIDDVCYKYLQGLLWTLQYYYKGCNSWDWYYPHHHAPTIKDLYKFMADVDKWKTIRLHKSVPYHPFEQLMFILPPESKHLLPESYQSLMTSNSSIAMYYPEEYHFDTVYRRFFWQCPPILPPINYKHLKQVLSKKSLNKDEQIRDKNSLPIIIKGQKSDCHD